MTAVEKLFVQIFEKKKAIIEQVKRQAELFDQHLASKLLIDDIAPPPWLWNPSFHALNSDPTELNKEELISGLLFPSQQHAVPYSNNFCSLYSRPVAIPESGVVPTTLFTEGCASRKDINSQDRQPVSPKSPINDDACASSDGPDLEASVTSPKDQGNVRTSGIYQEAPQSLVKIQRSKSRQRALEIRSNTKSAKSRLQMDSDPNAHTTGSGIDSLRLDRANEIETVKPVEMNYGSCAMEEGKLGDELELVKFVQINNQTSAIAEVRVGNDLESVKPVDINNGSSVVEEVIACESHIKEMSSNILSGRITRSRNSLQQSSSMNEFLKQGGSSFEAKEVGGTEKESMPAHQSDGLLESTNPSEATNQVSKARKVEIGLHESKEKQSNGYHGRMTRLRSSGQQSDCVSKPSFLGVSCDIKDDGGILAKSIGKLAQPSQILSGIGGDTDMQNVQDSQVPSGRILLAKKHTIIQESNEKSTNSISRSARLQDSSINEGVPNATSSNVSVQRDRRSRFVTSEKIKAPLVTQMSEERSLLNNEDLELSAINAEQMDEKPADHAGRDGRVDTAVGTEGITKPLNSNILDCSSILSTSTLNVPLLEKPILDSEGLDLPIDSGFQVSILPSPKTSDVVDTKRYSAMAPETELPNNAPVRASVCSGSTLNRVDHIVGLEGSVSRSPSDIIFVKPKLLELEKLEDCSLNELSSSALEDKLRGGSSEDRHSAFSGPADLFDKIIPISCQAKHNSSQVRPLLENHVYLSHEVEACRGSSEGHERETAEASKTSDVKSLSSEREKPEKDAKSDTLLKNDKFTEQKCLTALEADFESSCGGLLKHPNFNLSTENTGTKTNYSENKNEELDTAKAVKPVSDDGEEDMDTSGDPNLPTYVFVKVDETNVNFMQPNLSSDFSQYQTVDSYLTRSCISDDVNVGTSQLSERQASKEHIQQGGTFNFGKEGSCPQHKRRKIDGQLTIAQSTSPCLKVMPPQSIQGNHIINNFNSVEVDLKDLKFQQVPIFCDKDAGKPSVLVGEQVEQGELRTEERDSDANTTTSVHDQLLRQRWGKLGTGDCCSEDNVEITNHTTDIFDTKEQCILDDDQDSLCYTSIHEPKSVEHRTCTGISMEQRNSHLRGNIMFSGYCDGSSHDQSMDLIDTDPTMPILEAFAMPTDSGKSCVSGDVIQLEKMDLQDIDLEHASLLEQLCRSASMSTPLCHFPTTCKLQGTPNLNQSFPNGFMESMNMQSNFSIYDNDNTSMLTESGYRSLEEGEHRNSYLDCQPFSVYSVWDVKKPFASPVGKHWDRIASHSSSSERKRSLNPELPCINEENEDIEEVADKFQDVNSDVMPVSAKRKPFADITQDPNLAASVSEVEVLAPRDSMDSISSQINFTGTHKGKQKSSTRRYTNKAKETHRISQLESGVKSICESLRSRFSKPKLSVKTSMREGGPSLSGMDYKRNNIVSNMTSFIPLVQQKQAAAICTGKRDVKVKALEAAEAAKRLAEKKDNERKIKKEALKLERARLEQENMRQLVIEKKRKEEERKQKEANLAAKKRQREEEERKEKEKKRKRVEEAWKQQRGPEKLLPGKEVKKMKHQAPDERARDGKKLKDKVGSHRNMEEIGDDNLERLSKDETRTMASSTDAVKAHMLHEDYAISSVCGDNTKVTRTSPNRGGSNLVTRPTPEQSYDMSPYKCSDDEEDDEDEDERPNNKFIPSWSSKQLLELAVSSQQRVDPKSIFPPDTFCIAEVVMPRIKQ